MPLYDFECRSGHKREELIAREDRDLPLICHECGAEMKRVPSVPAKRTDGIYSYAPNLGSKEKFEKWEAGE